MIYIDHQLQGSICPTCYFCAKYPSLSPSFTLPLRTPPSRPQSTPNPSL